jgi:hypothetical protein
MKFFGLDVHVSVLTDFKTACPGVEVTDWCLSDHAWVLNRTRDTPDHINASTWMDLSQDRIRAFQQTYDSFLRSFDGFVVGHCVPFVLLYELYEKPVIVYNTVRYDLPFCWSKQSDRIADVTACLHRLHAKGLLTLVSNNRADQLYTQRGTGLRPDYSPSLGMYTGMHYAPTRSTFLVYTGVFPDHPLLTRKTSRHTWEDLASYRGIVHFPYEVSIMSCFEQYTAGIPLFFPSKEMWKRAPAIQSIRAYWGDSLPDHFGDLQSTSTWIEHADMYECFRSPNVRFYDSFEDLVHQLETFVAVDDRDIRAAHVESVRSAWARRIQAIVSGRFWTQSPRMLCYNRLPLLANQVYDGIYAGSGVVPQHSYPFRAPFSTGDVVFVKTDLLSNVLRTQPISVPITLVTGVSDLSPSEDDTRRILESPWIVRWIGCNILASHPKIRKLPIGVGEPGRLNGDLACLQRLHAERIPWESKPKTLCVPYHSATHGSRLQAPMLPKMDFESYMREINQHRFVICHRGNGVDTHRVCEALLMGSVPVVESSGLDDLYSQLPCMIVSSFESIPVSSFVWDPAKYERFLDMMWLRDGLRSYLL